MTLVAVLLSGAASGGVVAWQQLSAPGIEPATVLGTRFEAAVQPAAKPPASDKGKDKENHVFAMTAELLDALAPGAERVLRVTVSNPNNQTIRLLEVGAAVGTPNAPGCDPDWVTVTGFAHVAGATERVVVANGTQTLDLGIRMINLSQTNQDACKGASFPLRLSGRAEQVSGA
jgi:hypothetical protein